ncbi:aspartate dehydrogenase domain-containing protein [Citricoccus muralis]|uniref:L-aspartate dehydrogenase n=1 Tax=Citricoccus muralis TaxID=169134 RepID=A0ABY8H5P0_9MICC|nr:aspartate dehydrogenase domain-containing protein [Citricoccus muralis]WFP16446.1 DUF108 domain-containing protein [Citricoccus muralis]
MTIRVLLWGFGAIGRQLADQLRPERESGAMHLTAVVRDVEAHRERGDHGVDLRPGVTNVDWQAALDDVDLVVECAGVSPARQRGPDVIGSGRVLVLASVGALADPDTARALLSGPGRLWVTHGAIGGFDVLASAAEAGGLDTVRIRTRKLASSLIRPWMDTEQTQQLRRLAPGEDPVTVFSGHPAEAIELFPGNVNVAVALAWATRGGFPGDDVEQLAASLQRVEVELLADPDAELSTHEMSASGPAGRLMFSFESAPSPENPKTSGLTALSVAHTLRIALDQRRSVTETNS